MDYYQEPRYVNIYDDEEGFENQKEIISRNPLTTKDNKKIKDKADDMEWYESIDEREDRYDPLLEMLSRSGSKKDETNFSQDVLYLDINSYYRDRSPYLVTDKEILLDNDPLVFENSSNLLTINLDNHNFEVGDRITLSGVNTKFIKLRTKIGDTTTLQFVEDSEYLIINYEHGIPASYTGSDIHVLIEGVRGVGDVDSIGNINVNSINGKHIVLITKPEEKLVKENVFDSLKFYIKLPRTFSGTYTTSAYNFKIRFDSIYGVPISLINANYPVTTDNFIGFHTVNTVSDNSFTVKLLTESFTGTTESVSGGGPDITISKIIKIVDGYPDANSYSFALPKVINNVTSIKIVSSEFPNSINVFNSSNNKLYWQNIEDGDTIHSLEITPGTYSASELKQEIEDRAEEVPRTDVSESYENGHYFNVTIKNETGKVEIVNRKKAVLSDPIKAITPVIQSNPSLDTFEDGTLFTLTFNQKDHGLRVGDTIIVSGTIDHMGISSKDIDGIHTITSIEDDNSFSFELPKINISDTRVNTGGGDAVTVYVPSIFRMIFSEDDTCGEQLGFRDVGQSFAVTPFTTTVTNYDAYENDITKDENGNDRQLTNNKLKLNGYSYILMNIKNIENIASNTSIKTCFGKIQLNGSKDSILYNTYVDAKKIFPIPLNKLDRLDFDFYTPDGDFVDFSGVDHSFTLEIRYLIESPKGTNVPNSTSRYVKQSDIKDINI